MLDLSIVNNSLDGSVRDAPTPVHVDVLKQCAVCGQAAHRVVGDTIDLGDGEKCKPRKQNKIICIP